MADDSDSLARALRHSLRGPTGSHEARGVPESYYGHAKTHLLDVRASTGNPDDQDGPRKAGSKTLTVYGVFPYPWSSDKEEVEALNDGRWFPSDRDFKALANLMPNSDRVAKIGSFSELLIAMMHFSKFELATLNIITHGGFSDMALQGKVLKEGNVELGIDDPKDDVSTLNMTTLANLEASNSIDTSAPNMQYKGKGIGAFTFADARDRFGAGATMFLYCCHGGAEQVYCDELAKVFRVNIRGFKLEIYYQPEVKNNRIVNRTRCRYPPPPRGAQLVHGLHKLTPDREAKAPLPTPTSP